MYSVEWIFCVHLSLFVLLGSEFVELKKALAW